MQLARITDFSLRILMTIGAEPDTHFTSRQLAEVLGIPPEQMMKIVQRLARAGYLATRRGKGGGIALARPPAGISLGQVVRDMEPSLALVDCGSPMCPLAGACRLKGVLDRARQRFTDELDAVSLESVLAQARSVVPLPAPVNS